MIASYYRAGVEFNRKAATHGATSRHTFNY